MNCNECIFEFVCDNFDISCGPKGGVEDETS